MAVTVRIAQQEDADALLGREELDTQVSAECDPGRQAELFAAQPAAHHFPQLMARQVRDLCRFLVARHGGLAAAVWTGLRAARTCSSVLSAPQPLKGMRAACRCASKGRTVAFRAVRRVESEAETGERTVTGLCWRPIGPAGGRA